jgi:hypothetical protein
VQALPDSASVEAAIVPYEKFNKVSEPGDAEHNDPRDSVLVLWLKDDFLMHHPLTALSSLIDLLDRGHHPTFKFIGPSSSDMLHAMVSEALTQDRTCSGTQSHWKNLKNVKFYAYLASAPDVYLFGKLGNSCDFAKLGIHLQRTIATEDTLADGILNELLLRRINPTPDQRINNLTSKDDIALISEWDTFYGQTLPKTVEGTFAPDGLREHPWIHKFTYLRGLDGLLPSSAGKEDAKQEKSITTGTKPVTSSDFFKIENDTQSLERPMGESQYDYLRRIGAQLHKVDDQLRKQADSNGREKKIKAIGILGGDVFDKLLILRALRPEFPEALFFTTDFDEALTIKSELPFTRNLIISSTFGPNLSEWLQGDIPFFRDTFQTSAFLATQLALGSLHKKSHRADYASIDIPDQLRAPRIFEVNRNGEILPFDWVPPPPSAPEIPRAEPNDNMANGDQAVAEQYRTKEGRSVSSIDWPLCQVINGVRPCGYIQSVAWVSPPAAPQVPSSEPNENIANGLQAVAEQNPTREERSVSSKIDWPLCREIDGARRCGNIQPVDQDALEQRPKPGDPKVIERLFPTYAEGSRRQLATSLSLGALLLSLVALFVFRYMRKHDMLKHEPISARRAPNASKAIRLVEIVLLILGLGAGALLCVFWEPIGQYLTETGNGEPIALLDGISVWPTIALRSFGITLSIYFFLRIVDGLSKNLKEIAGEMDLTPEPEPLWSQFTGIQRDILTFWKWLRSLFQSSAWNEPLDVEATWRTYVGRERFWPRCIRAFLCTALMIAFVRYVLAPIFGMPMHPARGVRAFDFYCWTTYIDVPLMLFLTFFVFDATLSCLLFVNKLRRRAQAQWPPKTLGVYKGRLQLQTNLIHDWIDLAFVAKRTNCVGSLIYYPFVLIALLIVSRSTAFANYAPSLTILVAQGISLSIVFSCAIMLCWVARATRDMAKQNLAEGIIRAKDAESELRLAEQLETLLIQVAQLKEGAFSPLSQQPLVRALLFPLSSAGWVALIESGTIPGL